MMKIQTLFNEDKLFEMTLNYTQANQETNPWAGYSTYLGRLSPTEREARAARQNWHNQKG